MANNKKLKTNVPGYQVGGANAVAQSIQNRKAIESQAMNPTYDPTQERDMKMRLGGGLMDKYNESIHGSKK